MLGNAWEWCQEKNAPYPTAVGGKAVDDKEDTAAVSDKTKRVLRGGAFTNSFSHDLRAAYGSRYYPGNRGPNVGFRLART